MSLIRGPSGHPTWLCAFSPATVQPLLSTPFCQSRPLHPPALPSDVPKDTPHHSQLYLLPLSTQDLPDVQAYIQAELASCRFLNTLCMFPQAFLHHECLLPHPPLLLTAQTLEVGYGQLLQPPCRIALKGIFLPSAPQIRIFVTPIVVCVNCCGWNTPPSLLSTLLSRLLHRAGITKSSLN